MLSLLARRLFVGTACLPLLLAASVPRFAKAATDPLLPSPQLEVIATALQAILDRMGGDLSAAAASLSQVKLDSADAHKVLSDLCGKNASAVDCAAIDLQGVMVSVEPARYRNVENADISSQEQVGRLQRTRMPVLSKAFKAVEGFYGIDYEWPILTKKGDLVGSVSMLVKPQTFISRIVSPHLDASTADVWVMQADGQILYSRYSKEIGDNLISTPSYGAGPSFNYLLKRIAATPEGEGKYRTPPDGGLGPAQQRCTWKTIESAGTPWRVVIFETRWAD